MGRKLLFALRSFKKTRFVRLFLVLACLSVVTLFLFGDPMLIFLGWKVRDTAPITWRNPSMRNILVNNTVAKDLKRKIRILCVVPSTPGNEETKVRAVNNTWGSRCNKLLFVFTRHRSAFDHISLNVSEGRSHLTSKSMESFKYIHEHHSGQFDWVIKADDDSYLIIENLRLLLSNFNPNEPAYLGYHFRVNVHNGYMSGGGSYVLSKTALRMLVEQGLKEGCATDPYDEDVEVGRCMEKLGVMPYTTQDKFGRNSFHPNSVNQNIVGPLSWYLKDYPAAPAKAGPECCSQFSISFHYVPPDMMYIIDFLLYRVSVFGNAQLPADQLRDVFVKKVSEIKHNSDDEVISVKKYFAAPNYLPQEHGVVDPV